MSNNKTNNELLDQPTWQFINSLIYSYLTNEEDEAGEPLYLIVSNDASRYKITYSIEDLGKREEENE